MASELDEIRARLLRLEAEAAELREKLDPTEEGVHLSADVSNQGWIVHLRFGRRVKNVRWALGDEELERVVEATSTPGEPTMFCWVMVSFARVKGPTPVTLVYETAQGEPRGPIELVFDPVAQSVAALKRTLAMVPQWIGFSPQQGRTLVYFTTLLSSKLALAEIRWGVDDEPLHRRVHFSPTDRPGIANDDECYAELPPTVRAVHLQLLFADGTTSEVRSFPVDEYAL